MAELRVVATAGHVDHGKSSLILRLTGIDPDRWEEEKRRGLTIDLGYAWGSLPSGREVGFVDVPGHERFVGNMLAGVGPVPLVLFVVAANEGWSRQSEEHLAILDVLGVAGGVVALTKRDLVDEETLDVAEDEVGEQLRGTTLEGSRVVRVSATTGEGVEDLRVALDDLLAVTEPPVESRPRLFVDRVFTISGAGTVVTGTLRGGCLGVGDEVEIYPRDRRARIRTLQTHKRSEDRACPVARVAANLAAMERAELERGDVLGAPGTWRPTTLIEGLLRPIRGLPHPITPRGAYKVYAGAAEVDARLRLYGASRVQAGQEAFARIALARPLTVDVFDRFVLRDSGRRETVGGGIVLDPAPPRRAGSDPEGRLARRAAASRDELPTILADERGAVRVATARALTGSEDVVADAGDWLLRPGILDEAGRALQGHLTAFHEEHPLSEGAPLASARGAVTAAIRPVVARTHPELVDAVLDRLEGDGVIVRTSAFVRLPSHRSVPDTEEPSIRLLVEALGGPSEARPPTIPELVARGIGRDVIDAGIRADLVVRVSPDIVFASSFVDRAARIASGAGRSGITVAAFREALGTSRKFALPLLEWFDQRGITRREGDLRFPRSPSERSGSEGPPGSPR